MSAVRGYALTSEGVWLVQLPDENEWGFLLADEDQTWDGGLGVAASWEIFGPEDARVPAEVRERLSWLLTP